MKKFRRVMALLLTVCMLAGMSLNTIAAEVTYAAEDSKQSEQISTTSTETDFMKIVHLDCGRKYFTKDWIIALINEMEAAGYNQLQLAFGNDGMRFLLDDMAVTVNGTTYSSEDVTAGVKAGNNAYYDAGDKNELTQAEMTEIVNYAKSKGIEIIPHMNMPGHMDAILDAIEYIGISDAHFTGYSTSVRSLNLNNEEAVDFTMALLEKYVAYFDSLGCKYFHIGADEFGNDAYGGSMGFPNMGSSLYTKFADFVNEAASIVKTAGMTPRAWNDGISYTQYSATFDTDIQITYWSSGWSGYNVASASSLSSAGHDMINSNGDYYFVLKTDGTIQNPKSTALNFNNNTFMGSSISDPVGSMFCIWCDDPSVATEQQVSEAVRITLRKMAAAMQDTTTYSEDVVSGGFNEDGTINDGKVSVLVTETDEETGTAVTAHNLTGLTVTETTAPEIEDALSVLAWDMIPVTEEGAYTGSAEVSVPVPEDWSNVRGGVLASANGEEVLEIEGTLKDGVFTFNVPHFSTVVAYDLDTTVTIDLTVGGTETVTIDGVDLSGDIYTPEPTGIASVTVKGNSSVASSSYTNATSITSGNKYLITINGNNVLTSTFSNNGYPSIGWAGASGLFIENVTSISTGNDLEQYLWTITNVSGNNYTLKNADGKYLTIAAANNSVTLSASATNVNITNKSGIFDFSNSGYYLNNFGGNNVFASSWENGASGWTLYEYTEATEASTEVTFTGVSAGTTYVTINDTVYKIIVHGTTDITIKYVDTNGVAVKTETVTVADNASTYTLSNFNYNNKYYVVSDKTLTLEDLAEATVYTVTVTEAEEDLSKVSGLTVEYFITNQVVTIDGVTEEQISAAEVYSEAGVVFSKLVPASDGADNPKVCWKGWLLPNGYYQHSENDSLDMCTSEYGTLIEKIRYWNGGWAYFNGTKWIAIQSTDQIVAYYLQQTEVTDEVTTNVTDWGSTYYDWRNNRSDASWFWGSYVENGSKYVFLDFAVVYEDGTQVPNAFPDDNTWFFHFDGCSAENPRILKPITFTESGKYEIWKITVTDGTSSGYSSASTFESSYDETTETIVWSEEMGGTPQIESLAYTANMSGKLIRVYVRAVETEDTLTVVYYDEKFGDTLYTYNISVANGINFTNNIVGATTFDNKRIDVSNAYIVNALNKNQYFQTDLTLVPEAVGKYNSELYSYSGSVISEDGKTLYLYYNIDTTVLSPMFVADYGRPFTFNLTQVVGAGQADLVTSVAVNKDTRYGTLSYDDTTKVFTYTPTQVLKNIDVLTISIQFSTESTPTTTNAGVLPATTVDYEEGFATLTGFTGGSNGVSAQIAQVAGKSSDEYGFDKNVIKDANTVAVSNEKGSTAEFSFVGTGVDVYVNSSETSGNVAIQVRNSENKLVKVIAVQTTSNSTITDKFSNTEQNGLIAASVNGLPYGEYSVKLTTTNAASVYFDGFRVYGTIQDQANEYYKADLEDNPAFVELRDYVLTSMNVENSDSASVYSQIREATEGALTSAVLSNNITYDGKALLDNGPKNELFLLPGQSVVFKLTTAREVQVGLKAVNGEAVVTGSYDGTITSERDMFYTVKAKTESEEETTITITNDAESTSILSVTKIKVCDDPNVTFDELEADDLVDALATLGYEPVPVYADATLNIAVNDADGNALATTQLTTNGIEGEEATFAAADIQAAVATLELPDNYNLDDVTYSDVTVTYGSEDSVAFTAEKELTQEEKVVETVKQIFSSISNFFKKFFRW